MVTMTIYIEELMKKIILAAVAALAVSAASAQTTGTVKYEYLSGNSGPWLSTHAVSFGLARSTPVGTFDVKLGAAQAVTSSRVNGNGVEVGYSVGGKVGLVGVGARVAYGEVNYGRAAGAPASSVGVTTVGVLGTLDIGQGIVAVGSVEHVIARAGSTVEGQKYNVGAELPFGNARALFAFTHARVEGRTSDGLTTMVSYKF